MLYFIFIILEVINKETMQSKYHHHNNLYFNNTNSSYVDEKHDSLSNTIMNNGDFVKTEEKEKNDDLKFIEIGVQNDNKYDKPFIQVVMPDESLPSSFSSFEGFHYRESQSNQHTNSHDSLLQPDHNPIMDNINTATSSSDDLSSSRQLSSSAFHSKDSALGLSDDNLNCIQSKPFIIKTNYNHNYDEEDDYDHGHDLQQQDQVSLSLSSTQQNQSKCQILFTNSYYMSDCFLFTLN